MKKLLIPLALFFILILTVLTSFIWWRNNTSAPSPDEEKISLVIPKGRSASEISYLLHEKGLIKSPFAFKFYVQITGSADRIQAGEFELSASMNLSQLVDSLFKGPLEIWVTIPEGLRKEEVVERYIDTFELSATDAISFREQFLSEAENFEGYLFPDTYLFPRDVSAKVVVDRMKSVFDSKVTSQVQQKIDESGYTLDDIVKMASVIERETRSDDERPVVSGILYKRLKSEGWTLQADATIQYAIGSAKCKGLTDCEWWPQITREDYELDSKYNSYKFDTLPPTPIANPGLSSITAAVNPTKSGYWFYIHDSDGLIHYAETLPEHNANVSKYIGN